MKKGTSTEIIAATFTAEEYVDSSVALMRAHGVKYSVEDAARFALNAATRAGLLRISKPRRIWLQSIVVRAISAWVEDYGPRTMNQE